MDSQSYGSWIQSDHYMPLQHTTMFQVPGQLHGIPGLSTSPSPASDRLQTQMHTTFYARIADEPSIYRNPSFPVTPPDLGSDLESPYRTPKSIQPTYSFSCDQPSKLSEKTQCTSGASKLIQNLRTNLSDTTQRRRAQNRAAQRAFRERKEKHARDLEAQLGVLTDKYRKLEVSHKELNAAHERLKKTVEFLAQDADEAIGTNSHTRRRSSNADALKKLLEILHEGHRGSTVKTENT